MTMMYSSYNERIQVKNGMCRKCHTPIYKNKNYCLCRKCINILRGYWAIFGKETGTERFESQYKPNHSTIGAIKIW